MKRVFHPTRYHPIARKALSNGGTIQGRNSIHWDISAKCENPVRRELVTHDPYQSWLKGRVEGPQGVARSYAHYIDLDVRCRKCKPCLLFRQYQWKAKALIETRNASRTWLCTFTLSPVEQNNALNQARYKLHKQGLDFDLLDPDDRFRVLVQAIQPEFTRYLKRVRKNSASPLRYLLVSEKHKTGLPHFHALLHETDPFRPVTHALLSKQWRLGFSTFKLVRDDASAGYVCKYLAKSIVTRVRASQGYGRSIECETKTPSGNRQF